jgi:hypothetical protein
MISAVRTGRTVSNPISRARDDRLPPADVEDPLPRAMLTASVFEFTRPMYSSMIVGLLLAALMIDGVLMNVGMFPLLKNGGSRSA